MNERCSTEAAAIDVHLPISSVCDGLTTSSLTLPLNHAERSRSSKVPALFHTLAADKEETSGVDIGSGVLDDDTAATVAVDAAGAATDAGAAAAS